MCGGGRSFQAVPARNAGALSLYLCKIRRRSTTTTELESEGERERNSPKACMLFKFPMCRVAQIRLPISTPIDCLLVEFEMRETEVFFI
jgi:hypothetical protein